MRRRLNYLKLSVIVSGLSLAGFLGLTNCGQNQANHAPVCGAGQFLYYSTSSGYSCNYASVQNMGNTPSFLDLPTSMPNSSTSYAGIPAPVASCGIPNQILVNWNGAWLCYNNNTLYPGGSNSPTGVTPPVGSGGEYCLSNGIAGYGALPGVTSSGLISCSPGYWCNTSIIPQTSTYAYNTSPAGAPGICTR